LITPEPERQRFVALVLQHTALDLIAQFMQKLLDPLLAEPGDVTAGR
jgi:hypothetical protein